VITEIKVEENDIPRSREEKNRERNKLALSWAFGEFCRRQE